MTRQRPRALRLTSVRRRAIPSVSCFRHEVNRGEGGALKTAFAWFLEHTGEDLGVVTVDGDGQHTAADALRCARELESHPDSLVLGIVRRFLTAPMCRCAAASGTRRPSGASGCCAA